AHGLHDPRAGGQHHRRHRAVCGPLLRPSHAGDLAGAILVASEPAHPAHKRNPGRAECAVGTAAAPARFNLAMTELALHPPIPILGRGGFFVRSTERAAAFVREHMPQPSDRAAAQVLRRLEKASTAADAARAGKAFRAWIANGMHAAPTGVAAWS